MMKTKQIWLLACLPLLLSACVIEGENRLIYLNGQPKAVFTARRLEDGRLVKVGACSTWFANGQLQSVEHYDERGLPIGKWVYWDMSGKKLCEGEFRQEHNDLLSVWTFFHENGSPCRSETYTNGKKHGKWLYWHEDSVLCQESHYQNDTAIGNWTFWDKRGRVLKVEEYEHGIKRNEIIYKTSSEEK